MTTRLDNTGELSPLKRAVIKIEELQAKLQSLENARREPLAIIGVACRFPNGSNTPEAFWEMLRNGVDAVGEVPADRWDVDRFYDAQPGKPGKMYTRQGGFLSDIDGFEPQLFGIAPREAAGMDPQQRLLLEVTWEALESAGQAPDRLSGSRTGVFAGVCTADYAHLYLKHGDPGVLDAYFGSGTAHSIVSGRLSYVFGLQGPSVTIDTACSSSLVALHLACQSLRSGEIEMAVAGGEHRCAVPGQHDVGRRPLQDVRRDR
jgi:acyl transferase domain-containing protein